MSLSRDQIQSKINTILKTNPNADFNYIKTKLSIWLDTQDLVHEGLGQEFIKSRIMDDIVNYHGVNK